MAIDYTKIDQISQFTKLIKEAHDYELSAIQNANLLLAGDGYKAILFGTLSTPKTVTAAMFTARGIDQATADAWVAECQRLRDWALSILE